MKGVGRTLFVFANHIHADMKAISIFHSLLVQLSSDSTDMQSLLLKSRQRDLKSDTKAATGLLKTALQCAGTTFIVVDGLDEVDRFECHLVLYFLLDVLRDCHEVRICVSSRIEDDIRRIISEHSTTIRVDTHNKHSIKSYVDMRFERWMGEYKFDEGSKYDIQGLFAKVAGQAGGKLQSYPFAAAACPIFTNRF